MIHDMFFFHERARKINIWAFSFLIGPYLGPFISGFIAEKLDWRNNFGVLAGFYGFSVLLIVLFGDETLYDREHKHEPAPTSGIVARIQKLTGITGIRNAANHPKLWEVTKDLFGLLLRPYLLLPSKDFFISLTCRANSLCSIRFCHMDHHVDNWYCFNDHPIHQAATLPVQQHGCRSFVPGANDRDCVR
jgi:MFS family permease